MKISFQIEYGSSIEDFLDSVYLAGADPSSTDIEHHAKYIEKLRPPVRDISYRTY